MHESVPDLLRPPDCPLCELWVTLSWASVGRTLGAVEAAMLASIDDPACWNRHADGVVTLRRRERPGSA
jgi:hypothetical protein